MELVHIMQSDQSCPVWICDCGTAMMHRVVPPGEDGPAYMVTEIVCPDCGKLGPHGKVLSDS